MRHRIYITALAASLAFCGVAQGAHTLTLRRATQVAHRYVTRDIRSGAATRGQVTTCNRGADNRSHNRRQATCFVDESGGWQVLANFPLIVGLSHNGRFIDVRTSDNHVALTAFREHV